MGTSSGTYHRYELNPECDGTSDLITCNRTSTYNKTRVHMFYVDSNTTVPLKCVTLVFFGKLMLIDRLSSG